MSYEGMFSSWVKIIHPSGEPTDEEFEEIVAYAVEGRRRIKEQMNKRKPDDEFAAINLSYFSADGKEVIVYCPESRQSAATQNPRRDEDVVLPPPPAPVAATAPPDLAPIAPEPPPPSASDEGPQEKRLKVHYGDIGYGYESLFGPYLKGAQEVILEDPYIRSKHQVTNFLRFCEAVAKVGDAKKIKLITYYDNDYQKRENLDAFIQMQDSLQELGIEFHVDHDARLHDRELKLSNGWRIKMGRGLDYFQSLSGLYYQIGANDLDLRPCLEVSFDFYR